MEKFKQSFSTRSLTPLEFPTTTKKLLNCKSDTFVVKNSCQNKLFIVFILFSLFCIGHCKRSLMCSKQCSHFSKIMPIIMLSFCKLCSFSKNAEILLPCLALNLVKTPLITIQQITKWQTKWGYRRTISQDIDDTTVVKHHCCGWLKIGKVAEIGRNWWL